MIKQAKREFIFTENAAAPSCHASTVLPLADGGVLCAWFAGQKESAPDVSIWSSIRRGGVWSAPVRLCSDNDCAHWNPVLFRRNDGAIILCYKYGKNTTVWYTKYMISTDEGRSWTQAGELVPGDRSGGRGPVKNKPLILPDGTVIAGASTESSLGIWKVFFDVSHDGGRKWEKHAPAARPRTSRGFANLIQPALWRSADGSVHALIRSDNRRIYRTDSTDEGLTWEVPRRTDMPNNNSGLDCTADRSGRVWLVCNPVDVNWGDRCPICLFMSDNDGASFDRIIELDRADDGRSAADREYSYPAVVCDGGRLLVTYTWDRTRIVYWEITIDD